MLKLRDDASSADMLAAFRAGIHDHLDAFTDRTFKTVSPADQVEISWFMQAITHRLQLCAERRIRRLLINMPPRHGKSISASVALPAWILGRDPSARVCGISYSQELALKMARDTRDVMQADWYKLAFPETKLARVAAHDLETTLKGGRYATSIDGTLTGLGGDIFIVDDPNPAGDERSGAGREKVQEWFTGTLMSRFNNVQNGVLIVVQQRVHVDDLSGYLLEQGPDGWDHLNLPAIATDNERILIGPGRYHERAKGDILDPARETQETLAERERMMRPKKFAAQYQQNPIPEEGDLIKWIWIKEYSREPEKEEGGRIVQSWDTASKAGELSDFSVCTTWMMKGKDYFLLDVWRDRALFPDLKRQVYKQAEKWQIDVLLIEDKASGTQLIQQLQEENALYPNMPRPIACTPKEDKVIRMSNATDLMEQARVHMPKHATFMPVLKSELLQFPNVAHDDQVDSISQFLAWTAEKPSYLMEQINGRWYVAGSAEAIACINQGTGRINQGRRWRESPWGGLTQYY